MKKTALFFAGLLIFFSSFCQTNSQNYNNALVRYQAGEYAKALQYLEKVLTATPDDIAANNLAGLIFYRTEGYPVAIRYFDKVLRLDPNFKENYFFRAASKTAMNDDAGALPDFQKQAALFPKDPVNHKNLGNAYVNLARFAEAIQAYDKALELGPAYGAAYSGRGFAKFQLKQYAAALTDENTAVNLLPNEREGYLYRARIKYTMNDIKGACADVQKLAVIAPDITNLKGTDCKKWLQAYEYYNASVKKRDEKDYTQEIALLDKAITLSPLWAELYSYRAHACFAKGDTLRALEGFNKAISLDSTLYAAYKQRVDIKIQLNDQEGAIRDLDRCILLKPSEIDNYYSKGVRLFFLQRYDEALINLNISLDAYAGNSEMWAFRGYTYGGLKNYTAAIADFDKALAIDSSNTDAWINRGLSKIMLGDFNAAIPDLNKAISIDNSITVAWNYRGQAKASLEDYEGAVQDFDWVLKKDPKELSALHNRMMAKSELGDKDGACADYQKALTLGEPVNEEMAAFCK